MPLTQVAKTLYVDGQEHDLREKDVVIVTNPRHRQALANFHEFAFEHRISVVCQRCDSAITGQNNDTPGQTYSVACRCREFRLVR